MALARFFAKSVLAANSVLPDVTYETFAAALEQERVAVCVSERAWTREGGVAARLLVNLLARLYPRLAIVGGDGAVAELAAVARAINPLIDLESSAQNVEMGVTIGAGSGVGATSLYASSNGWVARVGETPLDDPGDSPNPIGAAVAACLAAANVFRHSFRSHLPHAGLDHELAFRAYDYTRAADDGPALPESVDFTGTHLVGAGAIGNAFLWTLAELQQLQGTLSVVDGEVIDLGNLQRYVLARDIDANGTTWKAQRAADALAYTNVQVIPHAVRWGTYLSETGTADLFRVCVALDTARDRLAVQASLPRTTLNAWTQVGDLGVSRHAFRGNDACLACVYLPTGEVPSEDVLVADALGLMHDLLLVRALLHSGAPPDDTVLAAIARHLNVPLDALAPFRGKPLRRLYHDGICGGLLLQFGAQLGPRAAITTPLAFQSALAGVLLAAELVVAASGFARPHVHTATSIDVLRPIGSDLCRRIAKHPSGRCLCQDADYIWRYDAKWNTRTEGEEKGARPWR